MSQLPGPEPNYMPLSLQTTPTTSTAAKEPPRVFQPARHQFPEYPIPIPADKFLKALKLYENYCLAKGLEDRGQDTQNPAVDESSSYHKKAGSSVISHPSTTTFSNYSHVTDFSSIEGFSTLDTGGEMTSYDGKKVRQRTRRPLSAKTKSQAALIRHLGSCYTCRSRKIPCPLQHHDIGSLEKAREANNAKLKIRPRAATLWQSHISTDDFRRTDDLADLATQAQSSYSGFDNSISSLLQYIGQPVEPTTISPGDIRWPSHEPHLPPPDEQLLPLGSLQGCIYHCAMDGGLCQGYFEDAGALRAHFETHFPFLRVVETELRNTCASCKSFRVDHSVPCYNCGSEGIIETWIYGSFNDSSDSNVNGLGFHDSLSIPPSETILQYRDPHRSANPVLLDYEHLFDEWKPRAMQLRSDGLTPQETCAKLAHLIFGDNKKYNTVKALYQRAFDDWPSNDSESKIREPRPLQTTLREQAEINSPRDKISFEQQLNFESSDVQSILGGPTTDSGYESLRKGPLKASRLTNTEIASVMSDNRDQNWANVVKNKLAASFSSALCQSIGCFFPQFSPVKLQPESISDVLKTFVTRIAYEAESGEQQMTASLVGQQQSRIAHLFEQYLESLLPNKEPRAVATPIESESLTLEEKMDLWNMQGESFMAEGGEPIEAIFEDPPQEDEEDFSITNFPEARKFLVESNAYQWLVSRLESELVLTNRNGTVIEKMRTTIRDALQSSNTGSSTELSRMMEFELDWHPKRFLEEQFPHSPGTPLAKVIVLCGSKLQAQASTCASYMHQVWPKGGTELLEALDRCISTDQAHRFSMIDDTEVSVVVHGDSVKVAASGSEASLAELGEQLAWMCSALRSSPSERQMMYSIPRLTQKTSLNFIIDCTFQSLDYYQQPTNPNGTCWLSLFRNPVIVKGYPILSRENDEKGLELSLNMMALLGNVDRGFVFDGTLLLKGFSTMFVPTGRIGKSLNWHFLFNEDQSRLPYTTAGLECPARLTTEVVDKFSVQVSRNFVGWAQEVYLHTGTKDIAYKSIRRPNGDGCEPCAPGVALERLTFAGGQFFTVGGSVAKGVKDTPAYLPQLQGASTYTQDIRAARSIHVVIFDVGDRRGWLVDGPNALLHLACTHLAINPSKFFDLQDFHYAMLGNEGTAEAALLDPVNRGLVIEEDTDSVSTIRKITIVNDPVTGETKTITTEEVHSVKKYLFQDLVRNLYHKLEWVHDRQNKVLSASATQLRGTDRDRVEGFAYMDLVEGPKIILPRELYLKPSGTGWVTLVKSIRAITLLGRGFGELITPAAESSNVCEQWMSVPKGLDYLAATVATLKTICDLHGQQESKNLKLAKDVYWHKAGLTFEKCECKPGHMNRCERVQELYSETLGSKNNPDPFNDIKGGVLFGRTQKLPSIHLPWRNNRFISENQHKSLAPADVRSDSGLGTSMSSNSDTGPGGISPIHSSSSVSEHDLFPLSSLGSLSPGITREEIRDPAVLDGCISIQSEPERATNDGNAHSDEMTASHEMRFSDRRTNMVQSSDKAGQASLSVDVGTPKNAKRSLARMTGKVLSWTEIKRRKVDDGAEFVEERADGGSSAPTLPALDFDAVENLRDLEAKN